ncbi:MAG: sulfatase [Myxococcota bacterium]
MQSRGAYVQLGWLPLTLVLSACGPSEHSTLAEKLAELRASCVVLVLDAAPASHLSSYGYARVTTPSIDGLAAEGILFERAYSQTASTLTSVPSYLSGLYPQTLALSGSHRSGGGARMLPERFAAGGFQTAGFSENPIMTGAIAAESRFEHFVTISPVSRDAEGRARESYALIDAATDWIHAHARERFFVYVHLFRPHSPYLPPTPLAVRFRPPSYTGSVGVDTGSLTAIDGGKRRIDEEDLGYIVSQYDANLFFADQLFGQVLSALAAAGTLDRTLVVVTADHGEGFGEHRRFLHNSTLYNEMIHVPLILRLPPGLHVEPARISTPVGLVDLVPTLVDLFSLPGSPDVPFDGRSLRLLLERVAPSWEERVIFSQTFTRVAVIDRAFKLITDPAHPDVPEELYRIDEDPAERRNLLATHSVPPRVTELREELVRFLTGGVTDQSVEAAAGRLSQSVQEQLRALGYIDTP